MCIRGTASFPAVDDRQLPRLETFRCAMPMHIDLAALSYHCIDMETRDVCLAILAGGLVLLVALLLLCRQRIPRIAVPVDEGLEANPCDADTPMNVKIAFQEIPSDVKGALLPFEECDIFDLQAMAMRRWTQSAMSPRRGQYIAMTLAAGRTWARCQQISPTRQVKALTCTPGIDKCMMLNRQQ